MKASNIIYYVIIAAIIQVIIVIIAYKYFITPSVRQLSFWSFGQTNEKNDWKSYVKFESRSAFVAGEPIKIKINVEIINPNMFNVYSKSSIEYFFPFAYEYPLREEPEPKPAKFTMKLTEQKLSMQKEIVYLMPGEYKYNITIPGTYDYFFCQGTISENKLRPSYIDKVVGLLSKGYKTFEELERESDSSLKLVNGQSMEAMLYNESRKAYPSKESIMKGYVLSAEPGKLPENCDGTLYPIKLGGKYPVLFESKDTFHIAPLETRLNVLNNKIIYWLTIIILLLGEVQIFMSVVKPEGDTSTKNNQVQEVKPKEDVKIQHPHATRKTKQ